MTKRKNQQSTRPSWRKNKLTTVVVCAALGCAGTWYGATRLLSPETMSPDGEAKLFAFSWKNGSTYTYALTWKARQHNRFVQQKGSGTETQDLGGSVSAQAELLLRSHGKAGGAHVLALSLQKISELSWEVAGAPVVKSDQVARTFDGKEAFLEVEDSGRIRQTFFAKDTPPEFRGFVQWLVPQLQVVLPKTQAEWSAHAWTALEDTSHGRVKSAYSASEHDPLHFTRKRASYESFASSDIRELEYQSDDVAEVVCASEGHLESIDSKVKLSIQEVDESTLGFDSTFALQLTHVEHGEPRPLLSLRSDAFQGYAPTETPETETAFHKALVGRVGNLTPGQMVSDVLEFANGGRMSQKWLWQATGLLQLNPDACEELGEVFADESFTQLGRGLILDLLASAGTPEAQKVLRELLAAKAGKPSETEQAVLFNRLSMTPEPTAETAEFVAKQFDAQADAPMGPMRIASAYAMGAVAGHQKEQGNVKLAEQLNAKIVSSLEQAQTPEEQAVMVRALGNAGMDTNVDTLVDYTQSDALRVRAAAADALRDTHNEKSMSALLELLRDPEWEVQQSALGTLAGYTLTQAEAKAIEDLVVAGVVGSRNDPLLVTVLSRGATIEHPLEAGFRHVLARNMNNGQLAARIRSIGRRNGLTL